MLNKRDSADLYVLVCRVLNYMLKFEHTDAVNRLAFPDDDGDVQ